jgi:SAM-dependent methyltransferase
MRNVLAKLVKLEIINSRQERIARLVQAIVARRTDSSPIQILEAGCGRTWSIKLSGVDYRLTGIDLDREALDHRLNVEKDLDEGILGDLSTHNFQERQFDVIYSAYVLEHIQNAEKVMRNFVNWLKPGGLLIIAVPDPNSARGFVTRITPHWFHVCYYRYLMGNKNAGKPGFGPYKTYFDPLISREGIRRFCAQNSLAIASEYGALAGTSNRPGWRSFLNRFSAGALALASFGQLSSRHDNLHYIIQKNA